jgi:hypothetical protein
MRHTARTLLLALLLQLVAGSAWALGSSPTSAHAAHCQELVVHVAAAADDTHTTSDPSHTAHLQQDSHHCCAVGLGAGMKASMETLPNCAPASPYRPWVSLSLSPNLRPPI